MLCLIVNSCNTASITKAGVKDCFVKGWILWSFWATEVGTMEMLVPCVFLLLRHCEGRWSFCVSIARTAEPQSSVGAQLFNVWLHRCFDWRVIGWSLHCSDSYRMANEWVTHCFQFLNCQFYLSVISTAWLVTQPLLIGVWMAFGTSLMSYHRLW